MNRYVKEEKTQMDYKSEKMLSMIKLKTALKYHLSSYQIGKKQSINTEEKWKFFDIGGGSRDQSSGYKTEMDLNILNRKISCR